MSSSERRPDCWTMDGQTFNRRDFVRTTSLAAAGLAASSVATCGHAADAPATGTSEKLVEQLYRSLTPEQRSKICFDWNHQDSRGLLRTHVSNNWNITDARAMNVGGSFFTRDQQELIEAIFFGLYNPDWKDRIKKQLRDDAGGYGRSQTIAIFGEPGTKQFEFVMTGRHLTIRCDGDSADHVAFGGPIFYGHASTDSQDAFNEDPHHPGNVFWPQAVEANRLYQLLDGKQRSQALIETAPYESEVAFRGRRGGVPGLPVSELSSDQKEHLQKVLAVLLDPYRVSDQEEVRSCLKAQGGLDDCCISFYQEEDLGDDGVWDIWRLEGPSFVWHYRGAPHVHVWVNVADDPSVPLNAAG